MTCANCEHNEGMVYASIPPRYRCAITKELHLGHYACDVEFAPVKHGKWVDTTETVGWPKWNCSVCGSGGRGDYKFCPWCGAIMDERREDG